MTTDGKRQFSPKEWLRQCTDIPFQTVALVGGPLGGQSESDVSQNSDSLRLDVAGKGVARYNRTKRENEGGQPIFEFSHFEDVAPPRTLA